MHPPRFRPVGTPLLPLLALLGVAGGCRPSPETDPPPGESADGAASAPTVPVHEGRVTLSDGVEIAYRRIGDGPQIVVAPVALYLAEPLSALADPGRTLVFYDPRNRGASGAGDLDAVSLDRQVADLEELRAALGVERMALIGWSGPAMEMAAYAIRHPDRVERLAQMSPVPPRDGAPYAGATPDSARAAAIAALDDRAAAGEFEDAQQEYCRLRNALSLRDNFADTTLAVRVPDVCVYPNEWPVNLFPYFGALLDSFAGYDWRTDLEGLEVPRLVIHGAQDRIPFAGGQEWARGYPNVRFLDVSPSGHFAFIEQAETTIAALDTFLRGDWPADARVLERPQPTG